MCSSFLLGQNEKAGTTGFAFMKMTYSARAMGMSNAFTGLSDDGDAVFFNTAGLSQNDKKHIKTTYSNYIQGYQGGSIVYATNYKETWKVAPFLKFLVSDDIPRTLNTNIPDGTFSTSSFVTGVGFASTINESLDVGFNIKYFYEKLDSFTATAIAGDFSILHQTYNKNLKIGATLKNIGAQIGYYTENEYEENLPSMFIAGASYKITEKAFVNFDLVRPFDNDFFGRLGVEYQYNTYFTMRTGLDTRMNDYRAGADFDYLSGIAFGFGFKWNKHIIDYAISSMGSLGFVNQMSISYLF